MEIDEVRPRDLARRLRSESNESFFSWVRLVIALSGTSLSILIAFMDNYVPDSPQWLLLLSFGFSLFAATIFSGLVVLHAEIQTKWDSAAKIEKTIEKHGEQAAAADIGARKGMSVARPIYRWAQFVFHVSLGLSFPCMVLFVVVNL